MELLNRIKELEKELLELKEQVKYEQEFPQDGDTYWYIGIRGNIFALQWESLPSEEIMLKLGNIFKTEDEAYFTVEKLKVETELRKYSRPFKDNDNNYFIKIYLFDKTLSIDSGEYFQTQGTIYFESTTVANEAIESVGEERIKKYIFGVED